MQTAIKEKAEETRMQYGRRHGVATDISTVDQLRSNEVDAFRFHHEMSLEDSLELVGLDQSHYRESVATPTWIPRPRDIELEMLRIRSGELVIKGQSK